MSIQYSGNAQTSTFTCSTKQNIIDNVETALLAAGWTTISGHGTTNLLMQSATTPQGFAINVRLKDNGGTCVTFSIETTSGSLTGANSTSTGGGFLNPAAGTYRVTCNKYQAFIYQIPYSSGTSRTYVGFGVPWVPSWVAASTSALGWMHGNAETDTDTNERTGFREQLSPLGGAAVGACECLYNVSLWNDNTSSAAQGVPSIPNFLGQANNGSSQNQYRYENGAAFLFDALICWGAGGSTNEGKAKGQLWDAVVSSDAYTADSTTSFDGHNWITLTAAGTSTANRGTLLLATS
jgi:hypothetical protein